MAGNGYAGAGMALKTASPLLNAVPYVGPILSMGAGIAGGFLEKKAADEQAAQARKTREEALGLKVGKPNQFFYDKLRADQAAALGGLPGYDLAKNAIDSNIATGIRAGIESGTSGAGRLALASALVGSGNTALNELSMDNSKFKAGLQKDVRNDLGMLGLQTNRKEDIRDKWKEQGLSAAAALENAATANSVNATNKILGSVTSTGQALLNEAPELGEIALKQKMFNIQQRINSGEQLSEEDLAFLQRRGISLESLGYQGTSPYTNSSISGNTSMPSGIGIVGGGGNYGF